MTEGPKVLEGIESREEISVYQNMSVISVAFSSTFTAVTTFFTSIIISKYSSLNPAINIPTLFLIISTFGFIYSTLVFSNITGPLLKGHIAKAKRVRITGNIISEYFGVYFLILAIPLIINVITHDAFLRIATGVADMLGLFVYHYSGFSIMERNYPNRHYFFLSIIILIEILLIVFQFSNIVMFEIETSILIAFISLLALFAHHETIST